jgi:hypothetical protein
LQGAEWFARRRVTFHGYPFKCCPRWICGAEGGGREAVRPGIRTASL